MRRWRPAPGCRSRRAVLPLSPERARRQGHQPGGLHNARDGHRARRSRTQCAARIRRHAVGYDGAPSVPLNRTDCSSGQRRFLQYSESPQFRESDQLPKLSSIRAIDADVKQLAVAARAAASILSIKLADRDRSSLHSNFSFKHQTARRSLCGIEL